MYMQAGNQWAAELLSRGLKHGLPENSSQFTQEKCYEALHNKWKNCLKLDRKEAGLTMSGEQLVKQFAQMLTICRLPSEYGCMQIGKVHV